MFVLRWFKQNWLQALALVLAGPFGLAAAEIYKHFGAIKQFALQVVAAIKQAIQELVSWVGTLPHKIGQLLGRIPGVHAISKGVGAIGSLFGAAEGGTVTSPGALLVGERGPELVTLPAAASVVPLGEPAGFGAGGRLLRPIQLTTQVVLDRKVVAQAVANYTSDRLART
jgi:hypothetical protein